jgi:hypothetical protein
MSDERWAKLSVRAVSARLTAAEIAHAIGAEPSVSVNSGDRVSERSPAAGVHDRAMCIYDAPVPSGRPLEEHVSWLVEFLRQHGRGLEMIGDKCEFDVRLGFSSGSGQGGFAIPAESLGALSRVKADLAVDLYPPGDDADDDDE